MSDDQGGVYQGPKVGVGFDPDLEPATAQFTGITGAIKSFRQEFRGLRDDAGWIKSTVSGIGSSIRTGFSGSFQQGPGLGQWAPGQNTNEMYAAGANDAGWMRRTLGAAMGGNPISAVGTAMVAPISYGFNRIEENRAITRNLSWDLGRVSTMSGTGIEGILKLLSDRVPVMGTPEAITGALTTGASAGFFNLNDPRSGSYYTALRQMQQFTPDVQAPQLAQRYNQVLGNTRAQQVSMMLTGGAMGNFGPGGVPKTLQEWAESTLRWFESQRPGDKRGRPFTKQELASQVFPGSNMSAWFASTGVSGEMQDYFWQYSMGKAQEMNSTQGQIEVEKIVGKRGGDLGLQTRATETATARRDFTLASQTGLGGGTMYQNYLTRESADRDFTNMMSQMIDKNLARILGGILGQLFAYIPTPIAGLMAEQVERLPGMLSGMTDMAGKVAGAVAGAGDPEYMIGDPGGYGAFGATGTAGMTPDMSKRVSAMMRANPRLRISSGFRDGALQGRLNARGVGRVAPTGRSMHSKGLAADLGPSSEYGWIAANAGRFGLASGRNHGEPWHVGFPGTIPVGDISDWWSGIQGLGSSALGSITSFGSNLFQGATSLMKGDWSALFGQGGGFDVGEMLSGALGGLFSLMGIPALLNPFALASGKAGKGATAKDFSGAFGGMLGSGQSGLIKPVLKSTMDWGTGAGLSGIPGMIGGIVTGAAGSSSGIAGILQKYGGGKTVGAGSIAGREQAVLTALQAAQAAGFSGDELVAITAIAGRESGWNPRAHNPNRATGDDSYGLYQINMLGGMGPSRRAQFGISSNEQLLDPMVSGRAAFSLTGGGKNFSPWGGYKGKSALYSAEQYVEPVYNLAKQHGFIGDPGWGGGGGYAVPAATINVANSINVSASGSTSPASLRRTAEQLAGFTTAEIRKQLARST